MATALSRCFRWLSNEPLEAHFQGGCFLLEKKQSQSQKEDKRSNTAFKGKWAVLFRAAVVLTKQNKDVFWAFLRLFGGISSLLVSTSKQRVLWSCHREAVHVLDQGHGWVKEAKIEKCWERRQGCSLGALLTECQWTCACVCVCAYLWVCVCLTICCAVTKKRKKKKKTKKSGRMKAGQNSFCMPGPFLIRTQRPTGIDPKVNFSTNLWTWIIIQTHMCSHVICIPSKPFRMTLNIFQSNHVKMHCEFNKPFILTGNTVN